MPKRQTNNLKFTADLMDKKQIKNANDKVVTSYDFNRELKYEEIGVYAEEKYMSKQSKTEVVKRINIRVDKSITEKNNAVRIDSVTYNIIRIYWKKGRKEMELSLAYVD